MLFRCSAIAFNRLLIRLNAAFALCLCLNVAFRLNAITKPTSATPLNTRVVLLWPSAVLSTFLTIGFHSSSLKAHQSLSSSSSSVYTIRLLAVLFYPLFSIYWSSCCSGHSGVPVYSVLPVNTCLPANRCSSCCLLGVRCLLVVSRFPLLGPTVRVVPARFVFHQLTTRSSDSLSLSLVSLA